MSSSLSQCFCHSHHKKSPKVFSDRKLHTTCSVPLILQQQSGRHMLDCCRDSLHVWAGSKQTASVHVSQKARCAQVIILVDSDWAGDAPDRRSTTGMVITWREAEYYAFPVDFAFSGNTLKLTVYSDASAARAFGKRRAERLVCLVVTRFLRVQERIKLKTLYIRCVEGKTNPADESTAKTRDFAAPQTTQRTMRVGEWTQAL